MSGDVPGADARITPADNNVLNVDYREKTRRGETTQSSLDSKIEEHRIPGEQPVITRDCRGVTRDQPQATTDNSRKTRTDSGSTDQTLSLIHI